VVELLVVVVLTTPTKAVAKSTSTFASMANHSKSAARYCYTYCAGVAKDFV